MIEKYVGRTVEMIYQDGNGKLSQRIILVRSINGDKVRAYCYTSRAPRTFDANRILSAQPTGKTA